MCYGRVYICMSMTSRGLMKTDKRIIAQTTLHNDAGESSFLVPNVLMKFQSSHPKEGAKYTWDKKIRNYPRGFGPSMGWVGLSWVGLDWVKLRLVIFVQTGDKKS